MRCWRSPVACGEGRGAKAVKADLAQQITDKILKLMLENGSDWRRPWLGGGIAKNVVSKRSYRGINIPLLGLSGFAEPWFGTYKQWTEIGAQVRKGEKATHIFFWKKLTVKDRESEDDRQVLMARSYAVFNIAQCDNAPVMTKEVRTPVESHAECERIIEATGADIRYGGDKAAYIPKLDCIIMPKREQFLTQEGLYGTLFHEASHWCGAKHRLDRDLSGRFGSRNYAFEELIAETSSALTCAEAGISPEPRVESAKYLNNWVDAMKEDKRVIITVFSKAQAATDYILSFSRPQPDPEPTRPDTATAPDAPEAPAPAG